jgi:PAS domain S-box-containing protein
VAHVEVEKKFLREVARILGESVQNNSQNEGLNPPDSNLNALLQSMVEGMIIQDNTGRIVQYNHAALEILGMAENELNEPDAAEYEAADEEAPTDLTEWDKIFPGKDHIGMNSLKTGEIQKNLVMKIFRYDGEVRWISLNAVPIMNNRTGVHSQVISTFTDITEMRRMLNDLKQVQLLFNISQDLMIIANQEGYFKRVNPRFSEVLGYELKEVLSNKFSELVHVDDLAATRNELKKITENHSIHFINRYLCKNGEFRVFDWVVVKDAETNLVYFTARDITDYRSEELDIIHSSKVYSIGEMTSGLSYMINGQVSIIGGHLSFLKSQLDQNILNPIDFKKKIQSIEESVHRLSKTIKDLSSFARNTEHEEIAEVSLNHIIENVLCLCKERFRIHCVKLDTDIEEDLFVRCRETQIAQVLITLLNNSYNAVHTQRDSWVKLTAISKNKKIIINITDSSEKQDRGNINISKGIIEENFGSLYYDHTSPETKIIMEFPEIAVLT